MNSKRLQSTSIFQRVSNCLLDDTVKEMESPQQQVINCPFAEVKRTRQEIIDSRSKCPFHKIVHKKKETQNVSTATIPINVTWGSYRKSGGSARLLSEIGGGDRIRELTTRFYAHAFDDQVLEKFMFETDGAAAHGKRLGDWIVEKMGGEGDVWVNSGRKDMRQVSHHKAWYSNKRPKQDRGRRFKLSDCRIWMRLMFWSARECGLDEHEAFWNWYVEFIGHFIAVYERSAPPYARESSEWSENQRNIDKYINNGYIMDDIHRNKD